jgi:hypothetical protein
METGGACGSLREYTDTGPPNILREFVDDVKWLLRRFADPEMV